MRETSCWKRETENLVLRHFVPINTFTLLSAKLWRHCVVSGGTQHRIWSPYQSENEINARLKLLNVKLVIVHSTLLHDGLSFIVTFIFLNKYTTLASFSKYTFKAALYFILNILRASDTPEAFPVHNNIKIMQKLKFISFS